MRKLTLGIMLMALTACASAGGQEDAPYYAQDDGTATLNVENRGVGMVRVYADGLPVGSVTSSGSCVVIPASIVNRGPLVISLKVTAEEPFDLPRIDFYQIPGWRVTLSPWPNKRGIDRISLEPAPRCDR